MADESNRPFQREKLACGREREELVERSHDLEGLGGMQGTVSTRAMHMSGVHKGEGDVDVANEPSRSLLASKRKQERGKREARSRGRRKIRSDKCEGLGWRKIQLDVSQEIRFALLGTYYCGKCIRYAMQPQEEMIRPIMIIISSRPMRNSALSRTKRTPRSSAEANCTPFSFFTHTLYLCNLDGDLHLVCTWSPGPLEPLEHCISGCDLG